MDYDLVVIGAGPTGLFAAYYAGFRGLSMAVVDSLPEPGGQVTAMYPEKMIYDVGGFAAVRGRDLVQGLVDQAAPWKPDYLLGRKAEKLESVEGGLELTLDGGDVLRAGAVLITAGIGEFTPRPLPAGDGWLGRGMVHFVPALAAHAGQHVVVVGGGDSAFDWCLALHPVAASVTLVHRRARFRAAESIVRQVRELGVRLVTDAEVARFVEAPDGSLAAVDVTVTGGADEQLRADAVVAALGFTADLGPIESWGLEIDHRAISVDSTMATARPRVYAAGDVAAYPGKVKLIATGFGEAATAVNNIAVALNPEAHLFPGHSSNVE
ncbi:NAD(P)/FAD-dependent oxidoreductase [Amycolatopsis rubida]|uniref:Ferredoxin--NADP reductase n=1 Tax=Amycolatopsis rubida TaxID=112413 RepID=A0A1I5J536_9PSEU|nr:MULTISPECIES: NAD(P)/FAD-dependent oxidoreductase [Amycolatopsis]MYW93330.1 FAD-dependent oxidoreductase [Amycolatopsis rubida]NEC58317.1 NAD(P)/FAD-dependent oxidoreductase [Amycolatopsis rubida]OAP28685.1 Ferredoxin--NADP reductase [Amycolatopsis sp. M39]SFO67994.1 thioredoxin reductase (NADPH) [Amycolatopsis rubida]